MDRAGNLRGRDGWPVEARRHRARIRARRFEAEDARVGHPDVGDGWSGWVEACGEASRARSTASRSSVSSAAAVENAGTRSIASSRRVGLPPAGGPPPGESVAAPCQRSMYAPGRLVAERPRRLEIACSCCYR